MARDAEQTRAFREASEGCPIPAAVDLIGERWTFLILRAAMLGICHFEDFQACLGIARNILSDRLGKLVEGEILVRSPDPHDKRRVVYSLTERGAGLLPVFVAMRQWASDAGLVKESHPILADRQDGKPVQKMAVRAHDGRALRRRDLMWLDDQGREFQVPLPSRRTRTAA